MNEQVDIERLKRIVSDVAFSAELIVPDLHFAQPDFADDGTVEFYVMFDGRELHGIENFADEMQRMDDEELKTHIFLRINAGIGNLA